MNICHRPDIPNHPSFQNTWLPTVVTDDHLIFSGTQRRRYSSCCSFGSVWAGQAPQTFHTVRVPNNQPPACSSSERLILEPTYLISYISQVARRSYTSLRSKCPSFPICFNSNARCLSSLQLQKKAFPHFTPPSADPATTSHAFQGALTIALAIEILSM